jgi:dTDP-4-dehydrorhamnose reductase
MWSTPSALPTPDCSPRSELPPKIRENKMTNKIGITGASGYLGSKMLKYVEGSFPIVVDVRNRDAVMDVISSEKPDVVIHLASISDVNKCEQPENEKDVFNTNVRGTDHVAQACEKNSAQMILLSTNHVFDGRRRFGLYTEKSRTNPINYYGFSKLAAEQVCLLYPNVKTIRTSYLFDYDRLLDNILDLRISDQIYPTFQTRSFVHVYHFIQSMISYLSMMDRMPKILNVAGLNCTSWCTFMEVVNTEFGNRHKVLPRREEKTNLVPRPHVGSLNVNMAQKLGLDLYSYWDGIQFMKKLGI